LPIEFSDFLWNGFKMERSGAPGSSGCREIIRIWQEDLGGEIEGPTYGRPVH
jgi:hypothetical protein